MSSILAAPTATNKATDDDVLRRVRRGVSSGENTGDSGDMDICYPCHGSGPGVHLPSHGRIEPIELEPDYSGMAHYAGFVNTFTEDLMKQIHSSCSHRATNPTNELPSCTSELIEVLQINERLRGDPRHKTLRRKLRQKMEEYKLPHSQTPNLGRLSTENKRNKVFKHVFQNLAYIQRHLQLVESDEDALNDIMGTTISWRVKELTQQHVDGLLCRLNQLPWRQSYDCEAEMSKPKWSITDEFKARYRPRTRRFYRDVILLESLRRLLTRIESIFTCLSEEGLCVEARP